MIDLSSMTQHLARTLSSSVSLSFKTTCDTEQNMEGKYYADYKESAVVNIFYVYFQEANTLLCNILAPSILC